MRIYRGDDGSALYLRTQGSSVIGFAEHPGRKYAFVLHGTRTKNVISVHWDDVAKGTRTLGGNIQLKAFNKNNRLVRSGGTDFGPDVFLTISSTKIPWPGAREAGFQSEFRTNMNGAFIGKAASLEPDGSRQYWRETSHGPVGVAEGRPLKGGKRPAWVSVMLGKRAGGTVTGEYFDVPKGTTVDRGTFAISPLAFGRRYAFTKTRSTDAQPADKLGPPPAPGLIEADYALDFNRIVTAINTQYRNRVVGYGYAISSDGKVVRAGGGGKKSHRTTKQGVRVVFPYQKATEVDVASVTKLVTATAVMRELDSRGMSVDSLVAPYFPSCWNLSSGVAALTWRQLLEQTSGIFVADTVEDNDSYLLQKASAENELTGPRGYSNRNYVMLGWLLAGLLDGATVEASFAEHGCGKATQAYPETMAIFGDYVVKMLGAEGVVAGWEKYRTKNFAFKYNFANPSGPGTLPSATINGTGGLLISARELGEFLAGLEHGRFVKRATLQTMKDREFGFDDLTIIGGPANSFLARNGLGLADMKSGGCGIDSAGNGCGAQIVMLPGDVQIAAEWNSSNNLAGGHATALRRAWEAGIK